MGFKALAAIADVDAPNAAVVALLYTLAQYADDEGRCYPSAATLQKGTKLSEGGLRNAVNAAVGAGLLSVSPRTRRDGGRSSNEYVLLFCAPRANSAPSAPGSSGGSEQADPPSPDEGGSPHQMRGVPSPDAGAFLNLSDEPKEADASNRVRGPVVDDPFGVLLAAWAVNAPGRVSRVRAKPAWAKAIRLAPAATVLAAGLRYLSEDPDVKRGRTIALDRWLGEARWEPWVGSGGEGVEPSAGATGPVAWDGPAELRAALLAKLGVGFAATLDRCAWSAGERRLRACTGWAFGKLSEAGGIFEQHGCELVAPNGGG